MSIQFETQLAPFARGILSDMGCDIRSEVHHIDIVGRLPDKSFIGVELKKTFNIDVLYQALRTKTWAGKAVIVVPSSKKGWKKERQWKKICQASGVGLWVVNVEFGTVVRYCEAPDTTNQGRLYKVIEKEFRDRSQDLNTGGSTKVAIYTAFFENYARVAHVFIKKYLEQGMVSHMHSNEVTELSGVAKANSMMYTKYKGKFKWFNKVGIKTYCLGTNVLSYLDRIEKVVGEFDKERVKQLILAYYNQSSNAVVGE